MAADARLPGMQPSVRVAVSMTQCWHAVPGGLASSVTRLVDALARRDDLEVVGVGPRTRRRPAPWSPAVPLAHLSLPLPWLYDAWDLLGHPSIESASGPVDLVHVTIPFAPRIGSTPVVATVHDLLPLSRPEDFTRRGARLARRGLERLRRGASAVAVPSEVVADECRARGFDSGRVVVVPWGVDPIDVADADVAAARRRHGLEGDYVLFVGTVEPRKGLATLAEAIALLDRAGLTLVVVGPDGWGAGREQWLAGVASPVLHTGFVDDEELASLRAGAAACCVPSHAEGFGLPVLEAMAAGAPVVTTRGTAMEEVAGGAALTVEVGDAKGLAAALADVIDDPALARSLRERGRARAGEFTWDRTAAAMVELYRRAVEDPR